MNNQNRSVAIVGATGMVGSVLLDLLASRHFPLDTLYLLASERSAGEMISFQDRHLKVESLEQFDFTKTQLSFFAAGDRISKEFAEKSASCGNIVIDKSACFRMDPDVPLVVPEVNSEMIRVRPKNIIASPNCSTIPVVMVLKPLLDAVGVARVNVATYQSVSGSGREGITELADQTQQVMRKEPVTPRLYAAQIAFNVLPQIDAVEENGFSREEMKLMRETCKILNDTRIGVNATAVRVPVFYGHSAAVHLETRQKITVQEARTLLQKAPGVRVIDSPDFPNPLRDAADDGAVVGRLREDPSHPLGLDFWVVGNNIRKGAALNAVQIAECILKEI